MNCVRFLCLLALTVAVLAIGSNQARACSAHATSCNASCSCTPPAGGMGDCQEGDVWASCYASDEEGNETCSKYSTCTAGGGGGSGGPGGGGVDCQIYWWLCDPWAFV